MVVSYVTSNGAWSCRPVEITSLIRYFPAGRALVAVHRSPYRGVRDLPVAEGLAAVIPPGELVVGVGGLLAALSRLSFGSS